MNKSCRLTNAHQHRTLPHNTVGTYTEAKRTTPDGTRLYRVRWIAETHEWQACYIPTA